MPLSSDVRLPLESEVVFPPFCAVCIDADPDSQFPCTAEKEAPSFIKALRAPGCHACSEKAQRMNRLRKVVSVSDIVVSIGVGFWVMQAVDFVYPKLLGVGVMVVCTLPVVLWEVLSPPAVSVNSAKREMVFEFRSADYAQAFAAANNSIVE